VGAVAAPETEWPRSTGPDHCGMRCARHAKCPPQGLALQSSAFQIRWNTRSTNQNRNPIQTTVNPSARRIIAAGHPSRRLVNLPGPGGELFEHSFVVISMRRFPVLGFLSGGAAGSKLKSDKPLMSRSGKAFRERRAYKFALKPVTF
jgi:hypothetical protein